jgi:acetylornithine deacetylase/succinyl-diaminopimelate desuccinylase-like protein
MQAWKTYQDKHKQRFLDELLALLKIPSISADSKYQDDMLRCAEAVKKSLLDAGVTKAEIYKTKGHPVVFGEKIADPSKPTIKPCRSDPPN